MNLYLVFVSELHEVGEKESLNLSIHGELLSDNALNKSTSRGTAPFSLHCVVHRRSVEEGYTCAADVVFWQNYYQN